MFRSLTLVLVRVVFVSRAISDLQKLAREGHTLHTPVKLYFGLADHTRSMSPPLPERANARSGEFSGSLP